MTIPPGSLTYTDEDGKVRPGPAPLNTVVNPDKLSTVDDAIQEHIKNIDNRERASHTNPHINGGLYSPLETLMFDSLREYGETNPGSMAADVGGMFLNFANMIIEDLRAHPYFDIPDLNYYTSMTETRPIPDVIIKAGFLHYYALQQISVKSKIYEPAYYRRTSTVLYNRKYGNGRIEIAPYE